MNTFRKFDLIVFSLLAIVAGFLSDYFVTQMSSGFYYTLKNLVLLICMIRWGKLAIIPTVISSIGSILLSEFYILDSIIYYLFADLFIILPIMIYGNKPRNDIIHSFANTVKFVVASYISLAVGKAIAIFIISGEITGFIDFFATSFFQLFMDILVLSLLKTVDGLVTDVKVYFEQLNELE